MQKSSIMAATWGAACAAPDLEFVFIPGEYNRHHLLDVITLGDIKKTMPVVFDPRLIKRIDLVDSMTGAVDQVRSDLALFEDLVDLHKQLDHLKAFTRNGEPIRAFKLIETAHHTLARADDRCNLNGFLNRMEGASKLPDGLLCLQDLLSARATGYVGSDELTSMCIVAMGFAPFVAKEIRAARDAGRAIDGIFFSGREDDISSAFSLFIVGLGLIWAKHM